MLHITGTIAGEFPNGRVSVSGIIGSPPPPTTKLAICTIGGYQLESSMHAVGLDIEGKLKACRDMIHLTPNAKDYSVLRVDCYGISQPNPRSQFEATVRFRIFAQAEKAETLMTLGPTIMAHALGGFCGLHGNIDPRPVISGFAFSDQRSFQRCLQNILHLPFHRRASNFDSLSLAKINLLLCLRQKNSKSFLDKSHTNLLKLSTYPVSVQPLLSRLD